MNVKYPMKQYCLGDAGDDFNIDDDDNDDGSIVTTTFMVMMMMMRMIIIVMMAVTILMMMAVMRMVMRFVIMMIVNEVFPNNFILIIDCCFWWCRGYRWLWCLKRVIDMNTFYEKMLHEWYKTFFLWNVCILSSTIMIICIIINCVLRQKLLKCNHNPQWCWWKFTCGLCWSLRKHLNVSGVKFYRWSQV